MKIPKYINKKIDKLNNLLEHAYSTKLEIELWAHNNGADIYSIEWCETVLDDISAVQGIYKEKFCEYMENISHE